MATEAGAAPTDSALWGRVLAWLGRRPRTEVEVARRLSRWGATPDELAGVLGRLRDAGLLDDAALAKSYAAELARKGYRGRAVVARLRARGVPAPLAAATVAPGVAQGEPGAAGGFNENGASIEDRDSTEDGGGEDRGSVEVPGGEDPGSVEDALAVAERRVRALPAADAAASRRLVGYLVRRGFPPQTAWEATRRVIAGRRPAGR